MPNPDIPEEAVHSAAKVIARALRDRAEQIKDGSVGSVQTETPNQIAESALRAALPAIREQTREEKERERLGKAVKEARRELEGRSRQRVGRIPRLAPDPNLFCAKCNHQLAWSPWALCYVRAKDGGNCVGGCKPRERTIHDA